MAKTSAPRSHFYNGPVTVLDLPDGAEMMLVPGVSYPDLPDTETVRNLVARDVLVSDGVIATPSPSIDTSASSNA